jgi:eukaryotic-like serine/threonine-protein kinase
VSDLPLPIPSAGPPSAESPSVPRRYGRYVLIDRLGAGGMAEVFRAVVLGAEQFQSVVVVKRILPRLCANPAFTKMFIDEAKLCGLLSHPNIVKVHDFGKQEEQYFIAMEYLEGRNLNVVLRRLVEQSEMMAPTIAAEIALQVCRGLAYAHGLRDSDGRPLGIIHRDVSPGNVMVSHAGTVKLLDFGVARVESRFRKAFTDPGQVKGKSSYVAPEQLLAAPYDHRADVFATGIVLHEMLSGRRLFRAGSAAENMTLVKTMVIAPPSFTIPSVPPRLDEIVMRALERDPNARFQSADEMADALEAFLLEARVSRQEIPNLMHRLFAVESRDEQIDLGRADLQALLARESDKPSPPPSPEVSGAASPGGAARSEILADWPEPSVASDGELAPTGGARRRVLWTAAGLLAVGLGAIGLRLWRAPRKEASVHAARTPVVPAETEPRPAVVDPPPSRPPAASAAATAEPGPPEAAEAETRPPSDATAAVAETVKIAITSDPSGAVVYEGRDRKAVGVTPLALNLPRSSAPVTLRVGRPGYAEARLVVVPDADKPAFVSLRKAAARGRNDESVRNAKPTDPFAP